MKRIDPEEAHRIAQEYARQHMKELRDMEALHKELHFVPKNPKDKELKPFYGTIVVHSTGQCTVTITRDEESWWLKKGLEICLDFGDCCDFVITPVD